MTSTADWRAAFPIQPATEAVEALRQAWAELAARPLRDFNPKTKEDALTKRLKIYIENYVAPQRWDAIDASAFEDALQQSAHRHQLDTANMQTDDADERRRLGFLFQDEYPHFVQPEFGGQHEAGRPASGHDHVELLVVSHCCASCSMGVDRSGRTTGS